MNSTESLSLRSASVPPPPSAHEVHMAAVGGAPTRVARDESGEHGSKALSTLVDQSIRVVLCGSFRRDRQGFVATFERLRRIGCRVLSPATMDFADETDGFVHLTSDVGQEPRTIEEQHLTAMHAADFAWLHAPEGCVGTSASLEVGYAHAIGLPLYTDALIQDAVLVELVRRVESPEDAVAQWKDAPSPNPGRTLRPLQTYYQRVAEVRGYTSESPQDVMLLITEELGELARAIRKHSGLIREGDSVIGSAAEELADVQLYVLHLASAMGVDLGLAVTEKERLNSVRSSMRLLRESA